MTIRMLHIADLHIGQVLRHQSRADEHIFMLNWVREQIEAHSVDVLLVAGDIFHHPNPTPAAQRIFFNFLADVSQCTSIKNIVITAGNHDSAKRLCALQEPLGLLNVHIVGVTENRSPNWDSWLVPIKNASGGVVAAVAAVPFIPEFAMGSKHNLGQIESAKLLKQGLKNLYTHFFDLALERYGEVPVVAMGHLTAMGEDMTLGYMPKEVHTILENALDGEIFDTRYRYVALGHIHKGYKVRGPSNAWYSGSPLACSIDEAEDGSQRGANLIEIDETHLHLHSEPRKLVMPIQRLLLRRRGTKEELVEALHVLPPAEKHPHFLWLELTETHQYIDLYKELKQVLVDLYSKKTPIIVTLNEVNVVQDGDNEMVLEPVAANTQGDIPSLAKLFRNYIQICKVDDSEHQLIRRLEIAARETEGVLQNAYVEGELMVSDSEGSSS